MFVQNKYHSCYLRIIERAKVRSFRGYTELHHIIPDSLGGDNAPANLVHLTAREHFICHWLLTKCVVTEHKQKMKYALWSMMNMRNKHQLERYRINSRTYATLKEKLANAFSIQHKGKKKPLATRQKMSESRRRLIAEGKIKVNENKEKYKHIAKKMRGRVFSEESRKKISNSLLGKKKTEEHRKSLSVSHLGHKHTEETKAKIRKNARGFIGRKHTEETKKKISVTKRRRAQNMMGDVK